MKKQLLFFGILVFSMLSAVSQNNLFQKKEFIYKNDTLKYRILYPENYDKTKKYPLVLFLHGAGERGNDNEKQLIHGSTLFTNSENRQKYPAIVVFPQCPEKEYWAPINSRADGFSYPESAKATEPMQLVIKLLNSIKKTEAIDNKRVYVTGLSMGGMGTYDLICRKPHLFAAAVAICGGVNTDRLKKVKKMDIRIYHGSADNIVSPKHSEEVYDTLKKLGSDKVELKIYPGIGHDSWTSAFAEPDFLSWLFSKSKK
ncbi:MAG: prolyl oligopeptidase family serine peptidase [Paludibacter sp.]|nr:prolyl oligopeptidase family serine peptidase [Paludibacter sp.]